MKTTVLATHLLPLHFDLQTPDTSSPNSLLYGLLGLLLIGVIQAVYVVIQVQKETKRAPFEVSHAQFN